MMLEKSRKLSCKTCHKMWEVPRDQDEDYFFYQIKKMGTMKYIIEYSFCSKECMMKYLKSRKEPIKSE